MRNQTRNIRPRSHSSIFDWINNFFHAKRIGPSPNCVILVVFNSDMRSIQLIVLIFQDGINQLLLFHLICLLDVGQVHPFVYCVRKGRQEYGAVSIQIVSLHNRSRETYKSKTSQRYRFPWRWNDSDSKGMDLVWPLWGEILSSTKTSPKVALLSYLRGLSGKSWSQWIFVTTLDRNDVINRSQNVRKHDICNVFTSPIVLSFLIDTIRSFILIILTTPPTSNAIGGTWFDVRRKTK